MTVDALKNNPFSFFSHDMVLHLESPEAHSFRNYFRKPSLPVINVQQQLIEIRFLCAPQREVLYRQMQMSFAVVQLEGRGGKQRRISGKRMINRRHLAEGCFHPAGAEPRGIYHKLSGPEGIVEQGLNFQILDVRLRSGIEINIPVNS